MATGSQSAGGRNRRDEIVHDGFEGYVRVAMSVALRRFPAAFPSPDDLRQAATLAALEVFDIYGADSTLDVVGRAVERALYAQARDYGQREWMEQREGASVRVRGIRDNMSLEYEVAGKPLSITDRLGVHYVGVGEYSIHLTAPIY